MSRRMSVSMTVDAVRARRKTVTRRHPDTWKDLKPGDRLTLIEKGMGLPKGAKQVIVCEVEIVDVRVEPLWEVTDEEVIREGFTTDDWGDEIPTVWFSRFWLRGHRETGWGTTPVRRIEWRYLDDEEKAP